jgi:murein DD-endopeptidase MepM/ murein hydrolase activator NlpD
MVEREYMNKYVMTFLGLMALMLVSAGIFFFVTYYEGEDPVVTVTGEPEMIGKTKMLEVRCSDKKSGIRNISVSIWQDEKQYRLESVSIPDRGMMERTVPVIIRPGDLHLHDGPAELDISATDHSLRRNVTNKRFTVTIDTMPPRINQLNAVHYVNPGGSAVTFYTVPEAVSATYVYVGERQFPSYRVTLSGISGYICYFALPLDSSDAKNSSIGIAAIDKAGNMAKSSLPIHIREKSFRSRTMNLSKAFLNRKIPELEQYNNMEKQESVLDAFRYINGTMRAENLETIRSLCKTSVDRQLWSGTFIRMENSATMAKFGDHRTYVCEGETVGSSIHNGVDLASVRNAPVQAANNGIVTFTGNLGIYGNTVLIDHGLGLFSIFVGNQFVDPQEWWDPHWIQDNVDKKLDVRS